MEKMKIDITVEVTTDGTREEAIEDLACLFSIDSMQGEEHGVTRIEDVEIVGRQGHFH